MPEIKPYNIDISLSDSFDESNQKPLLYFDAAASNYLMYKNNPSLTPISCQYVSDGSAISAIIPSSTVYWVANFLSGSESADDNGVEMSIDGSPNSSRYFGSFISDIGFEDHNNTEPSDYDSLGPEYKGPKWYDVSLALDPSSGGQLIDFVNSSGAGGGGLGGGDGGEEGEGEEGFDGPGGGDVVATISALPCVAQVQVRPGMHWGITANDFLEKNQPFWVYFHRATPPSSDTFPTVFCIEVGGRQDGFDIFLNINSKPIIVDHGMSGNVLEFEQELSRIWQFDDDNKIGVFIVLGRLVVSVNGTLLIYTRFNDDEEDENNTYNVEPIEIPSGNITVRGTNAKVVLNVSYMSFTEAAFAIPIVESRVGAEGEDNASIGGWKGINEDGELENSVAELPDAESGEVVYGVDCKRFYGAGGSCSPSGSLFNELGEIEFISGEKFAGTNIRYYYLHLIPEDYNGIPMSGCPVFMRIRGGANIEDNSRSPSSASSITNKVVSFNINQTVENKIVLRKSAEIKLYDDGGANIQESQSIVNIDIDGSNVFTGVVVRIGTTKEIGITYITLECEDFMFFLQSNPVINSPIYDGMFASAAIKDLASKIKIPVRLDIDDDEHFFLPSSNVISEPVYRFDTQQMLLDCMVELAKMFNFVLSFDEQTLVVEGLEGGIFSSGASSSADFILETDDSDSQIIDQYSQDIDLSSTVNSILIVSVDRHTNNRIVIHKTAQNSKLVLPKRFMYFQPALGDMPTMRTAAERLSINLFAAIKRTSFSIIGYTGVQCLSFFEAEGQLYRCTGLSVSYNADSNDLRSNLEGSWKGGD